MKRIESKITPTSSDPPRILGLFDGLVDLDSVLDGMPVGVVLLDAKRRVVTANLAFEILTGYGRSEARGIHCRFILRSDLCLKQCPASRAGEKGERSVSEGDIIGKDRKKLPVRLSAIPLTDADGRLMGFLETVEDLSRFRVRDQTVPGAYRFEEIIGRSRRMEELFRVLPMIAQTDSAVLITGETGTGKDLVAETVHRSSMRSSGPFVKVNCGALPETLLESELFGHKKGAFTGAVEDKLGRIRLAHKGALYLTEIGDLPLSLQVKLLTFLDDKTVHPLGSTKTYPADVRIIAATHRDLERMVAEGIFREDLLYRLNVVRLPLPALRERDEDVGLLLDHYLNQFARRFSKQIKGFSPHARRMLERYAYPGNVRELRNIVEYAANLCQSERIGTEHLPAYFLNPRNITKHETPAEKPPVSIFDAEPEQFGAGNGEGWKVNWETVERKLILDALVKAKGRRSKAAEILGWGRSTLWRKIRQHGIDD